MSINDLTIIGAPPPRLGAAFSVIADLHETFAEYAPGLTPGISKRSCVLSSLTVRDFLRLAGFDAEVRPCMFMAEAWDIFGEVQHTLGVGTPDWREGKIKRRRMGEVDGWRGHLVCILPAERWVIDTTLFQARRPTWPHLPGMFALPINPAPKVYRGMDALATLHANETNGDRLRLTWLDQRRNRYWETVPDAAFVRRSGVVRRMLASLGP